MVVPISGSVRPTADNQEEDGAPPKPVAISPRPAPLFESIRDNGRPLARLTPCAQPPSAVTERRRIASTHSRQRPWKASKPLSAIQLAPGSPPSLIYILIGLLGGALFIGAVLSMLTGKASPANLFIGLLGILLMAPAGGYFLLHFLNRRDGVDA